MRVWKQESNTITVTSGQYLVVYFHDAKSHGRNTHRMKTSAVHDIFRFRYQRMRLQLLVEIDLLNKEGGTEIGMVLLKMLKQNSDSWYKK